LLGLFFRIILIEKKCYLIEFLGKTKTTWQFLNRQEKNLMENNERDEEILIHLA